MKKTYDIGARIAALLFMLGSLVMSHAAFAGNDSHHPMRFDRITLEDGLSQSNVFAIHQDSNGLMWFGTENGLNAYNGYEFEVFKRERGNPAALFNDYVYDIAEDSEGNLWIASNGGGLARMDRKSKVFQTFRHDASAAKSVASNVIRTLLVDDEGMVWLGTLGAGVDRFDPQQGTATNYQFGEAKDSNRNANEVFAIHLDSSGLLWIGTNDGLVALDTESGQSTHHTHSASDSSTIGGHKVRAIFEDSHGELWIGTYSGGLNRFDRDAGTFERFVHNADDLNSLSSNRVTTIFEDSEKRLWVGTYAGLNLLRRDTQGFVRYQHENRDASSLSDDKVTTLFEDRSGILWVGTRNQGLNKWNPRSWSLGLQDSRQFAHAGETQSNITSFVEDAEGKLWIGTFGEGLHVVDRAKNISSIYRHDPQDENSISDDRIMSLTRDRSGNIWIGTMTGGLNRLNPDTEEITTFTHSPDDPTSLGANGIMAIFEDSVGSIWVGTYGGGANRFDPESETFTRFQPSENDPGSISSNRVRAFAEDLSGHIWIGTDSGGLNLFDRDTEQFSHFRHDPYDPTTIADDTIYSITVDLNGTVWVGTQGAGVDRVIGSASQPEKITFKNLSQSDGLANDVIYGLLADNSGALWMSTSFGISQYNPSSGEIKNMRRDDGLQSNEFNSGARYKSARGELFFGGPNGYNAFLPKEVKANSVVPLIALTGIYNGNDPIRAGEPVDENEGIDISYKDDVVSFEFAALDYSASESNQYRYKLEGFDKEWIELGTRRRVTYTDLNDGQYLLRVQASNSDGLWNEAGFSLPVRVSPAPWDTWWAYLGYAAMAAQLAAFLWLGHKRKVRREEEYSARLEQEVRERTAKLIESNRMLKKLNQTLHESSLSDPLTGLRNRRFVFEEVSRDLDVIRRRLNDEDQGYDRKDTSDLVFMMIDLDHFKPINDTYGHAAGDQMLLDVRDLLLGTCRKSDFVVRWGGDEFVVIAKQARRGESEALAERIRRQIAEHNFELSDGQVVRTTCSIGFAAFPLYRGHAENGDIDEILTIADSLMYEAKQHRNAWAGILSPSEAATSFDFEHETIEPTSILFRAKRAGQLISHTDTTNDEVLVSDYAAGQ